MLISLAEENPRAGLIRLPAAGSLSPDAARSDASARPRRAAPDPPHRDGNFSRGPRRDRPSGVLGGWPCPQQTAARTAECHPAASQTCGMPAPGCFRRAEPSRPPTGGDDRRVDRSARQTAPRRGGFEGRESRHGRRRHDEQPRSPGRPRRRPPAPRARRHPPGREPVKEHDRMVRNGACIAPLRPWLTARISSSPIR
jgi:hypothetical protein